MIYRQIIKNKFKIIIFGISSLSFALASIELIGTMVKSLLRGSYNRDRN